MKRMRGLSRKIAAAAREQRGLTLIEATIGLALLEILGVIFLSAVSTSTEADVVNNEWIIFPVSWKID